MAWPTAASTTAAIDELADAIERTFGAEHVFVAAGDPAPLVAALWRRAVRAAPAPGVGSPDAYDLVVVLGDASGGGALTDAVAARTQTVLFAGPEAGNEPGASLLATIERFAERSFDVDPIADVPVAGLRALVFRRVAQPLPPGVRRAYAGLLNRSAAAPERETELAALRERTAALEREADRLRVLGEVERSDRMRAEADLRRVVDALAESNDALAEQLESARAARMALDRDIQALGGSPLWRLKLAVGRRLRRSASA